MTQGRKSGRHPTQQLTHAKIARIAESGRYFDGHGLYLRVSPTGSKCWAQRFRIHGRDREIGHGAFPLVSLATARERALLFRDIARNGGDPLAERRRSRSIPSLSEATTTVIEFRRQTWKSAKHAKQWQRTMETYVFPRLGEQPINSISSADILEVLGPIWHTKSETARRLRGRLRAIFNWAISQGWRSDNPAGEALDGTLSGRPPKRKHFAALPYSDVAQAIELVHASKAALSTKLCFEFIMGSSRGSRPRGSATIWPTRQHEPFRL